MERVIVDTGVLVAIERARQIASDVLPDDVDIVIAAITAAELLVGVELADVSRRAARQRKVDAVLAAFDIISYDLDIARHHANLLAHTRRTGRPRGAHDLQIAATGLATGRTLLTTDGHAFDDLPGLRHRVVSRD